MQTAVNAKKNRVKGSTDLFPVLWSLLTYPVSIEIAKLLKRYRQVLSAILLR